ncbi:hypothetical protein JIN85_04460 [Luteolibacter pohnpeiensis]|uniref:Uncharacterized protein n=1 Tax=Luteolibacter pohnpeiensis TaxID=454153 RepID=A0A934S8I8_9BACT|nr:hypothetical protein [Luteolibacter pohnpeiensis]MBK1881652.1 hypothetical protein [Luteolibacter pohnpeiensis]
MISDKRKPLWLLPNLLSLDAPLVAVAWLFVFAKTWRVASHPWSAYAVLFLAVWVIYVADRLLDAALRKNDPKRCEERHHFHWRHRGKFLIGLTVATITCLGLTVTTLPIALFAYIFMGMILVMAFFAMSLFSSEGGNEISYLKNIFGGLAFGYGTAMLAHVYQPAMGGPLELLKTREFLCFSALCVLNISAIDLWEHSNRSPDPEVKAADELALTLPLTLLGGASLVFALLDHQFSTRPFFYATLTGAALLQILNRTKSRFSLMALRVLADVALMIPLIIFVAFPSN